MFDGLRFCCLVHTAFGKGIICLFLEYLEEKAIEKKNVLLATVYGQEIGSVGWLTPYFSSRRSLKKNKKRRLVVAGYMNVWPRWA